MVLKHTPLGEINLPFVASNAIIPRCRRNRRQTESHQACLNGRGAKEGNSKLTDAHSRRRQSRQARAKRRAVCEFREICVKLNHLCEVILMRLPCLFADYKSA